MSRRRRLQFMYILKSILSSLEKLKEDNAQLNTKITFLQEKYESIQEDNEQLNKKVTILQNKLSSNQNGSSSRPVWQK